MIPNQITIVKRKIMICGDEVDLFAIYFNSRDPLHFCKTKLDAKKYARSIKMKYPNAPIRSINR